MFTHINKTTDQFRDESLWIEIFKLFPQYLVETEAYKSICDVFHPEYATRPFTSWSRSLAGIRAYLESGVFYDIDNDPGFVLLKGVVLGFDLKRFVLDLKNEGRETPGHVLRMAEKEDEVIALEVKQITVQNKTTWFDLFYSSRY